MHTIDEEVRKIIDRNYARAKAILEEHEDKLHVMAKALMRYETIDEAGRPVVRRVATTPGRMLLSEILPKGMSFDLVIRNGTVVDGSGLGSVPGERPPPHPFRTPRS